MASAQAVYAIGAFLGGLLGVMYVGLVAAKLPRRWKLAIEQHESMAQADASETERRCLVRTFEQVRKRVLIFLVCTLSVTVLLKVGRDSIPGTDTGCGFPSAMWVIFSKWITR